MPRECAESGCPNQTDAGLCRECSAERKYGTDSRAYNPDGSKATLRDTETRDDTAHASATNQMLANADDADLEAAGIDPDETPTEWRCPDCGEVRKTYDGERPDADCLTCGDATEWVPAEKEVRCDGGTTTDSSDEWEYGDPVIGPDVPKSVRRGGATGPAERSELSGNGVALRNHSVAFECTECGDVRRFATAAFMTMYRCHECADTRWFEFKWDLNRARDAVSEEGSNQ